jgi:hypothetical protein
LRHPGRLTHTPLLSDWLALIMQAASVQSAHRDRMTVTLLSPIVLSLFELSTQLLF